MKRSDPALQDIHLSWVPTQIPLMGAIYMRALQLDRKNLFQRRMTKTTRESCGHWNLSGSTKPILITSKFSG